MLPEDILCFQCGKPIADALDVGEEETPCRFCLDRLLEVMPPIVPSTGDHEVHAEEHEDEEVVDVRGEDVDDRPVG